MTPQTLLDKIWAAHSVADLGEGWTLLHIDRNLLHDLSKHVVGSENNV